MTDYFNQSFYDRVSFSKRLDRGLIPCEVWYEPSTQKAAYSFQDYSDFGAYRSQQIHYGGPEKTAQEADEMLLRMKSEIEKALARKADRSILLP
jgi:hypothetical protein